MEVSIQFLGMQRLITQTDAISMPITEKTRVNDALKYVRSKYPALHLDEGMFLITVNHKMASLDMILKDNDAILFLPSIHGG